MRYVRHAFASIPPLRGPTALLLLALVPLAGLLLAAWGGGWLDWSWAGPPTAILAGGALAWAALREIELREARAVLRAMPCHALISGPDRRPLWQAGSGLGFGPALGPPNEELRLKTAYWHLPAAPREAMINAGLDAHLRADGTPQEVQDGEGRWFELRHQRLPGGRRVCFATDITAARHRAEGPPGAAQEGAFTDLPERATFRSWLTALAADARGGALLLLDLDHLPAIHARPGQDLDDAPLQAAARRLRDGLGPSERLCRLGADEFAILADGATPQAALALAGRLRAVLRAEGLDRRATASIGIAAAPLHGDTAEALLRAAKLALAEAKAAGHDAVRLVDASLRERAQQRERLREALAAALEDGEPELHLQPQRDMRTGAVVGAEALLRWHSHRLGRAVSPAELLPVAAEAGLLPRLDLFVLGRAVALLAQWRDGPEAGLVLGINVSVASLHDVRFAEEVRAALGTAQVPSWRLEIEIPEDLAIRDLPAVQRTLQALRELGVTLALDDFGGGHSGLPHMLRLPVQRLKLDRSIVASLPEDAKAGAVLRATMSLARGLGMEVVGEGAETEAHAEALRQAGCHLIQGWLVAHPKPVGAFLTALQGEAGLGPARTASAL